MARTPATSPRLSDLIALAHVPELLRVTMGRPVHRATLHRWVSRGLNGVLLKTYAVGATLCTTEEDLLSFFEEVAQARRGRRPSKRPRRVRADRVERELDRMGVR